MKVKHLFLTVFVLISIAATSASAKTQIKLAILAPENSAWFTIMKKMDEETRAKTSGRVEFKIYPGGVLGDERDVIRKMRIGQVHAAGFTGLGLGIVNPEVRVLELPMLVSNYEEADALASALQPKLERGFQKKGFVLLGWAETGFVNIFSNEPIRSRKDMDGKKMWAWEGDPLVETMYRVFNIVPIPLPLTDVLTSLQTHLIDAVYAPPLAAIALQWFTQTKYITDLRLADSTGGILITKKALNMLSPEDQKVLKDVSKKYSRVLVKQTREDNKKSYDSLIEAGLIQVKVPPADVEMIKTTSKRVWSDLVGKLYSQELLDEAIAAVNEAKKN